MAGHERLAARLAAGDVGQGGVQPVELSVQEIDRAQGQVGGLAGDGGQPQAGSQARPWVVRSQARSGRPWWYSTAWIRCCQAVR
jgi:hypothetical protein